MTNSEGTITRRRRFAQIPDDLITDPNVTHLAVRVWARLDKYAGDDGRAFPSLAVLAKDLRVSGPTLDRAIANLVKAGWIRRGRRGFSNVIDTVLLESPCPAGGCAAPVGNLTDEVSGSITDDATGNLTDEVSGSITDEVSKEGDPLEGDPLEEDQTLFVSPAVADVTPPPDTEPESEPQPALTLIPDPTPPKPDSRGTRLPADWQPGPALIAWTRDNAPGVGWPEVEQFRDYWTAAPGPKARKLDWDATWRTWIRRENTTPRTTQRPTRSTTNDRVAQAASLAPFAQDLDRRAELGEDVSLLAAVNALTERLTAPQQLALDSGGTR